MKQHVMILGLTGALLSVGLWTAHAAERGRWAERRAALGLTEEQQTQMRSVLQKHRPEIEPLIERVVAERRALREQIQSETFDEAAVRAQAARVAAVEADLAVARAKVAAEIRPLLTEQQREQLADWQEEREAWVDFALQRIVKRLAGD
jgi:protein CpxP